MSGLVIALRLALADLRFERVSALCQVIGLAALVAPLLILLGVRNGLIADRTASLLQNPENLRLSIARTDDYPRSLLDELARNPDVAFVAPHPIQLGVIVDMARDEPGAPAAARVSLLATGDGDPYLPSGAQAPEPGAAFLSASLAGEIGASPGDKVIAITPLNAAGGQASISFSVAGILAPESWTRVGALLNERDLFLIQDWTDGRIVGDDLDQERANVGPRDSFPSMRLYATDARAAMRLVTLFAEKGIPIGSTLGTAKSLVDLSDALDVGFAVIAGVALLGYTAALSATLWNAINKKRRSLSLLRLAGLGRFSATLFPIVQALVVALIGWFLALLAYQLGAAVLDGALGRAIELDQQLTRLSTLDVAASGLAALFVALIAAGWAAVTVTRISPEEGLVDA
ncbi:MAG: FtsX-like permease family protein [Pseudomonadota bacterium]|nr:FtsX-like permease family protein [Pseudomonadota bacterium]